MSNLYQLGWFSTGRDKAARDLLKTVQTSIKQGEIEAEIAFVFCTREPGESEQGDLFLKLVEDCGIPLVCFSYQRFKAEKGNTNTAPSKTLPPWRLEYDRELMKRLEDFHPDLCVLAGYMLIAGAEMCRKYNMINLHPAAPGGPKGTWQQVIWQLIEKQANETGVMMHLATPELDMGPPVTYCTFPIKGEPFDRYWDEIKGHSLEQIKREQGENNHLFRSIRKHGLAREFPLIIATLKAFGQGKIRVNSEKQVVDADGKLIKGYNLTDEIDRIVRGTI